MYFIWLSLFLFVIIYICFKIYGAVRYLGRNLPGKIRILITAAACVSYTASVLIIGFGVYFIILMHLASFLLLFDIVFFIIRKIRRGRNLPRFWEAAYRSGLIAALCTALMLGYGYFNMYHIVRTEYTVFTEKNIREDGYTIVFISDLHYGISLDRGQLEDVCASISGESPDIVVLCGDIVDERTTLSQMREAFDVLGKTASRYGVYYVYGNHDKRFGAAEYTEYQLTDAVSKSGIQILDDSVREINEELTLIGRADRGYGENARKSVASLVDGLNPESEWIVLDHQPADYNEVENNGGDLILSGHTHAGQLWPAGIFAELLRLDEMNYGYKKQGNLNAIVSSGIAGWGYPLRTSKYSEYVVVYLKSYFHNQKDM